MADPIVTLAEAKDHLNITTNGHDGELSGFIDAATAFVERHIGAVVSRSITETVTPTDTGLIFLSSPVISITSMTAAYGYPGTYTPANWNPDGSSIVASYGLGTSYPYPVTVTYVGGYAVVPADLRQATLDYVKWRWLSQRGSSPMPTSNEEFAVAMPATVPYRVMEVIDGYRLPGVA